VVFSSAFLSSVRYAFYQSGLDGVTGLFNPECRVATPVCGHVFQLAVPDADVFPAEVEGAAASQVGLMRFAVVDLGGFAYPQQYLGPRMDLEFPGCRRFGQFFL
jgi:hypothetical protein